MLHKKVLDMYNKIFVQDHDEIESWMSNGPNSIRIKFKSKIELVFTYKTNSNWRLETRDSFINSLIERPNKK